MVSYTQPMESYSYSQKQYDLLAIFEGLIAQHGINLKVNEPLPEVKDPVSLDVEHDEEGGYVGIGGYVGSSRNHYWYPNLNGVDTDAFSSLYLIAHNGISDIDLLNFWGLRVDYSQLVHDTMLYGHIIDSSLKAYGLKDMSKRELGIVYPSYDDIVGKRTAKQATVRLTLDKQPPRLVQLYNAMDCFVTERLYAQQQGVL